MAAKDLVLLGGGHSHVEVLRAFGQRLAQHRHHNNTSTSHPKHQQPRTDHRQPRFQAAPWSGASQASIAPTGSGVSADGGGIDSSDAVTNAADVMGGGGAAGPIASTAAAAATAAAATAAAEPHQVPQLGPLRQGAVRLTLVSRDRFTPYSGMLPGWASGFYSYGECHIDLQCLASYAGARLVVSEATGLDIWDRTVRLGDGTGAAGGSYIGGRSGGVDARIRYDVLSIDVGITPGSGAVPGADLHATPVKPIDGFVRRYDQLLKRYRAMAAAAAAAEEKVGEKSGDPSAPAMRVCVVGGGAGGVELAAAVRYRLEEERRRGCWGPGAGSVAVSLLCRGRLLPGHPPHVRRLVRQLLAQRGVDVRAGDAVVRVDQGELLLQSGGRVPYDECLWCTEASPAAWLRRTGLPTDPQGFLAVTDRLQSDGGPPEVFAAGDVASCAAHPRPKAGVYAVRQGPPLAANLRAFLEGEPLRPFQPQATALALISLGDRFCVASRTGVPAGRGRRTKSIEAHTNAKAKEKEDDADDEDEHAGEWPLGWLLNGFGGRLVGLTGPLLWRWKDSIDRAFMRKYGTAMT